jgi:hypothetical protein
MNLTDILYCSRKTTTDIRRGAARRHRGRRGAIYLKPAQYGNRAASRSLAPVMLAAAAGERAARRRPSNQLANIRGG